MSQTMRTLGLKDVFYAVVTSNTATKYICETPKKLANSITLQIKSTWATEDLYADSALQDSVSSYTKSDVSFEGEYIRTEALQDILGQELKNGVLKKTSNDIAKEIAILARVKRPNGKYAFITLPCGKMSPEEDSSFKTDTAKLEFTTASLKGTFKGRELNEDGLYEFIVMEEDLVAETDMTALEIIERWSNEVAFQCNGTITFPENVAKTVVVGANVTVVPTAPITGVTYISSDPTTATVDNTGKIIGVKAGNITITAKANKYTDTILPISVTTV